MDYKSIIESKYNRQNWQLLLHDIFGNKIKFWDTPSNVPTSRKLHTVHSCPDKVLGT